MTQPSPAATSVMMIITASFMKMITFNPNHNNNKYKGKTVNWCTHPKPFQWNLTHTMSFNVKYSIRIKSFKKCCFLSTPTSMVTPWKCKKFLIKHCAKLRQQLAKTVISKLTNLIVIVHWQRQISRPNCKITGNCGKNSHTTVAQCFSLTFINHTKVSW